MTNGRPLIETKMKCRTLVSAVLTDSGQLRANTTERMAGTWVRLWCGPRHTLQGREVLYCQREGKWNHPIPRCVQEPQPIRPEVHTMNISNQDITTVAIIVSVLVVVFAILILAAIHIVHRRRSRNIIMAPSQGQSSYVTDNTMSPRPPAPGPSERSTPRNHADPKAPKATSSGGEPMISLSQLHQFIMPFFNKPYHQQTPPGIPANRQEKMRRISLPHPENDWRNNAYKLSKNAQLPRPDTFQYRSQNMAPSRSQILSQSMGGTGSGRQNYVSEYDIYPASY